MGYNGLSPISKGILHFPAVTYSMVEGTVEDDQIVIKDFDNITYRITTDEWIPVNETTPPSIERSTDIEFTGKTGLLTSFEADVTVHDSNEQKLTQIISDSSERQIPPEEILVTLSEGIYIYYSFKGPATIKKGPSLNSVIVDFPEPTAVRIGIRSFFDIPSNTVSAPATPKGLAEMLSVSHANISTQKPDQAWNTLRGHPPKFEVGPEVTIPKKVAENTKYSDLRVIVPPTLDHLTVMAPLIYYLQADVTLSEQVHAPEIKAADGSVIYSFSSEPDLENDAAQLLKKVFFLDTIARNAGPYGIDIDEMAVLEDLSLDIDKMYNASIATRLKEYLNQPEKPIDKYRPQWPASMHLATTEQYIPVIPYGLDLLATFHMPDKTDKEPTAVTNPAVDQFVRGKSSTADSKLTTGKDTGANFQGWAADGVPADKCKINGPLPFENWFENVSTDWDSRLTVVINENDMGLEKENLEEIYSTIPEQYCLSFTIEENLTRAELKEIIEGNHSFFHFIGHGIGDGLQCEDGVLTPEQIDTSNVHMFFLNACGSWQFGQKLLEKGSTSGAVTVTEVPNKEAVKIGTDTLKLLLHGFDLHSSVQIIEELHQSGKNYTTLGAASRGLINVPSPTSLLKRIVDIENDQFTFELEYVSTKSAGSVFYQTMVEEYQTEGPKLAGNTIEFTIPRDPLADAIGGWDDFNTIYDGRIYSSRELEELLDLKTSS